MGQTAQTVLTDISDRVTARKRTVKPLLTRTGHYTGNLIAFQQLQIGKQPTLPEAELAPQSVALRGSTPATPSSDLQVPASNDSVIIQKQTASAFAQRSKIAAAVLAALATGAVIGGIWTANNASHTVQLAEGPADETKSLPSTTQRHLGVVKDLEAAPALSQTADKKSVTSTEVIHPIAAELNAARTLADEYLEEIDWLHSQNFSLQQKVDALQSETTALNSELLELELEITTLQAAAQSQIETRTVYNFVNVPIGSNAELSSYDPASAEFYDDSVEYVDNTSLDASNYLGEGDGYAKEVYHEQVDEYGDKLYYAAEAEDDYEETVGEHMQDESNGWDGIQQPALFIDPYSGERMNLEDISDLQAIDDVLIYDPETGYYSAPNYTPEGGVYDQADYSTQYPPIRQ